MSETHTASSGRRAAGQDPATRLARLRKRPDPGVADLQPLIPISATVFVLLIGLSLLLMAANLFNPIHLMQ